jgi:hypothetical protein
LVDKSWRAAVVGAGVERGMGREGVAPAQVSAEIDTQHIMLVIHTALLVEGIKRATSSYKVDLHEEHSPHQSFMLTCI